MPPCWIGWRPGFPRSGPGVRPTYTRPVRGTTGGDAVRRYHERSTHHPDRYAPGPGFLDWANQPEPFRTYVGAPAVELPLAGADFPVTWGDLHRRRLVRPVPARPGVAGSVLRAVPGPLRLEAVSGRPLGAAVQPLQRQPAPDRGLRRAARAAGPGGGRLPLREPRPPPGTPLTPPEGRRGGPARRAAARGTFLRRPLLDPLARGLEVRRAGLPLLPARRGARPGRSSATRPRRWAGRPCCSTPPPTPTWPRCWGWTGHEDFAGVAPADREHPDAASWSGPHRRRRPSR